MSNGNKFKIQNRAQSLKQEINFQLSIINQFSILQFSIINGTESELPLA
jgi:hypothetical protein